MLSNLLIIKDIYTIDKDKGVKFIFKDVMMSLEDLTLSILYKVTEK